MKPETALRETIKKLVPRIAWCTVSWIESHATAIGVPDLSYCCNGIEGWIELKAVIGIGKLEVRPAQVRWMENRIAAGGKPFFIIKWNNDYHMVEGKYAQELKDNPTRETVERVAVLTFFDNLLPQQLLRMMLYDRTEQ